MKNARGIAARIGAAVYGFLVLIVVPSAAASDEMTVEDAIRTGLANNYAIGIARYQADIAENNKGKGTANFLPRLDAEGAFRYDGANESTGSPASLGNRDTRTWSGDIRLSWTLFDGFRMFADKRRYDELARTGVLEARDRIETTVVSIMRAFFYLVQQEQLLDVVRETRNISRTRLEREEIRRDLGGTSSTDLLNARVNFNKDQSTLLDQELAVVIARKDLNILLARDPLMPIAVKKEIRIPQLEQSFEQLNETALDHNSSLRAARHSLLVAQEEVRIAESIFFPRVDLSGSYGYTDTSLFGNDVAPLGDRNSHRIRTGVGLVLSYNLFNGNVDSINLENARYEELNRQLALKDTRNRITGLVQETHTTFQKRMEKVTLEEQNLDTARKNLKRQQERYETGASDSLDFRDAQVNLAQAQVRLIVARYDARISLLELRKLTGKIAVE